MWRFSVGLILWEQSEQNMADHPRAVEIFQHGAAAEQQSSAVNHTTSTQAQYSSKTASTYLDDYSSTSRSTNYCTQLQVLNAWNSLNASNKNDIKKKHNMITWMFESSSDLFHMCLIHFCRHPKFHSCTDSRRELLLQTKFQRCKIWQTFF